MGIIAKNVLICPLNWGLGHVSRIVPIITKLNQRGHHIYVACNKQQYFFLKKELDCFEWIPVANPEIFYNRKGLTLGTYFRLFFQMIYNYKLDRTTLKKILKRYPIDVVISDNRYGCYSKKITSIIITHQTSLILPRKLQIFSRIVNYYLKKRIEKFHYCWIPDVIEVNGYAGILSHANNIKNSHYIGLLSRFNAAGSNNKDLKYEVIAVLSGPEPQRSIFFDLLLKQMMLINMPCVIVKGEIDDKVKKEEYKKVTVYNYLDSHNLEKLIAQSKYIIARSGYSTIMDLICLNRTALLVPTPGQTEQEYLASFYDQRKMFYIVNQEELNLNEAIQQLSFYNLNHQYIDNNYLEEALQKVNL